MAGMGMHRSAWLLPLLTPVLQGNLERLNGAWGAVGDSGDLQPRESAAAANAEVVQEHLLRELTTEHILLLCLLHDRGPGELTVTARICMSSAGHERLAMQIM